MVVSHVGALGRECALGDPPQPEQPDDVVDAYAPGVPQANKDQIFEPYFSTRPEGVGLGLAIVGEIVSGYYGGALQLLDHGPLSGANFLVTLRKRV